MGSIPRPGEQQSIPKEQDFPTGDVVYKPNAGKILVTSMLPSLLGFLILPFIFRRALIALGMELYLKFLLGYVLLLTLVFLIRMTPFFYITITDTHLVSSISGKNSRFQKSEIILKDILLDNSVRDYFGTYRIRTKDWDSIVFCDFAREQVEDLLALIEHRQTEAYQQ